MAYEVITLNLIPSGEIPVIHAAQFDKARPLNFALKLGDDDFDPSGYVLELQIRKVDNNIVTAAPASTSGNVVTFNSTEQMTACSGTNLGEIQITKDDLDIATLHFYLVVQRDVLAGGVTSESAIHDLEEQIAAIVPQVIGDDYYTAEEVDEKIAEIPTFDPTNYYDKSDVDTLLNGKADVSDLPDMTNYYDKSETDALLDNKANVSDLPDMNDYYTKSEVDTKITDLYQIKTVSGSVVHIIDGGNAIPLKSLTSEIVAVQSGSGTPSPSNPRSISGFDSGVITVTDNDQITNTYTFTFGQTVYGGHFDNKGNLVVTHGIVADMSQLSWTVGGTSRTRYDTTDLSAALPDYAVLSVADIDCEVYPTNSAANLTDKQICAFNQSGTNYVRVLNSDYVNDVAGFTSSLSGKKLVYKLANPITLAITSQDIPTLLGENNIFSNTGDVEVQYFTSKSDGIAELIRAFL